MLSLALAVALRAFALLNFVRKIKCIRSCVTTRSYVSGVLIELASMCVIAWYLLGRLTPRRHRSCT